MHQRDSVVGELESVIHVTASDIADYTETVVPEQARRSNLRMFAQFLSMQAVFGAVLVGYDQGLQRQALEPRPVSYLVGSFVFPIMGYMVAALSNSPDFGASIRYFVNFSMLGVAGPGDGGPADQPVGGPGRQPVHRR